MYMQHRIVETPVFLQLQAEQARETTKAKSPLIQVFRMHRKAVFQAAGSFLVANAAFYVLSTGMVDYGIRVLNQDRSTVLALVVAAGMVQVVAIPLWGRLSDSIGRRKLFLFGTAAMGIWVWPMFMLADTRQPGLLFLGLVIAYVIHSSMYGPLAAMFVEMFPADVRFTGASLGYQIASVVAGGFAPTIMAILVALTGASWSVSAYLTFFAILTFVAVFTIKEHFRRDLYAVSGSAKSSAVDATKLPTISE